MYFLYIFFMFDPINPQNVPPPYVLHLKPQENAPCPLLDQNLTFSLNIMTLPRVFNFWNVDTPKPENAEKN